MLRSNVAARVGHRLLAAEVQAAAGPCGVRGFASGAQEPSRGPNAWWRDEKWNEPQALYDEVVRRFDSSPPPGRLPVLALIDRITKKEEATLAIDAVDRYRRDKASKGDFTGLGTYDTGRLISLCLKTKNVSAASSVLERHQTLGLSPTQQMAFSVVAAASREGGDATAAAYKGIRACGFALDPAIASETVHGLSRKDGGGAKRALTAAEAFSGQGVKLSAKAWASVGVAAASEGDAETALAMAEKAKASDPPARDLARALLVQTQAMLLQGAPAEATGGALAEAAKAAALDKKNSRMNVGLLLQKWAGRLGKADEGLKQRMAEAVGAAVGKGAELECDLEAAFSGGASGGAEKKEEPAPAAAS